MRSLFLTLAFALIAAAQPYSPVIPCPAGATTGTACFRGNLLTPVVGAPAYGGLNSLGSPRITSGPNLVAIGDSIIARDDDPANNVHADSFIDYAQFASTGKFQLVRNSGVAGNTTAQMLARFSTDVLAYNPQIVAIMGGTNDTTARTQTYPNLKGMIAATLQAGALPVLCTIPPQGTAAISPPTVTTTPSTTGGTLATLTYGYRVSAVNSAGETLAATEVTASVTGPTGSVALTWTQIPGATAYKIYGRTTGAELLMATNNNSGGQSKPFAAFIDTGSITPSGALPGANTTAVAYDSTKQTKIAAVNSVIQGLAQQYGIPVVDMYSILVDPTTGLYKTGFTIDGTHPTDIQSQAMGVLFASTTSSVLSAWSPYIAQTQTDLAVIYANPLFALNNATDPTSWGRSGGTSTATITTDSNVKGSVYQFSCSTPATANCNDSGPAGGFSGWSVGDVLAFSGWWKVTGASNGGQGMIALTTQSGAISRACTISVNADTPGSTGWVPFYCEGTVSAGTTQVFISANISYGVATINMAQFTVRNLTVLGLRPTAF